MKGEWLVGEAAALDYSHVPEPRPGTILSSGGQKADLFNLQHYPVQAVCRICEEPIHADSFFRPFRHEDGQLAVVYQFPVPRAGRG